MANNQKKAAVGANTGVLHHDCCCASSRKAAGDTDGYAAEETGVFELVQHPIDDGIIDRVDVTDFSLRGL